VTSAIAAAVWYRRDTRLIRELMQLADSLAQPAPLAVVQPEEAA
jgi:hypothetical protein